MLREHSTRSPSWTGQHAGSRRILPRTRKNGLVGKIYGKPWVFPMRYGISCRCWKTNPLKQDGFGVNHPKLAFHKQRWFFYQRNWRANKHEYVAKYINYSYYSLCIKKFRKKMAPNRTSAGVIGSVSHICSIRIAWIGDKNMFIHAFFVWFPDSSSSPELRPQPLIQSNIQKRENLQYAGRKNHQVWFLS